ncbi:hypothetical protein NL676_019117 [Syzygium grande]|nr:hypothetical protein NL676_019117 [Syzygium grande]
MVAEGQLSRVKCRRGSTVDGCRDLGSWDLSLCYLAFATITLLGPLEATQGPGRVGALVAQRRRWSLVATSGAPLGPGDQRPPADWNRDLGGRRLTSAVPHLAHPTPSGRPRSPKGFWVHATLGGSAP